MSKRVSPGVFLAVWTALLVCLGLTLIQNVSLRRQVAGLTAQISRTFEVQLGPAPGDLVAIDVRGNEIAVPMQDEEAPATVVFVASGSCPFCQETMAQWRELESNLGDSARYALLRLDGNVKEGAAELAPGSFGPFAFSFPQRPDFEWILPSDPSFVSYRLRYVPQTIVARGGEIVYVKTGPLNAEDLKQIESAVAGLSKDPSDAA